MIDAVYSVITWMIYAAGALGVMVILGIGAMILYAAWLEVTKKPQEKQGPRTLNRGFRQDRGGLR